LDNEGKHLEYPETFNNSAITGIAYALSTSGKINLLTELLLEASLKPGKDFKAFSYNTNDALAGIAIHSVDQMLLQNSELTKKYDYSEEDYDFIIERYAKPHEAIEFFNTAEDRSKWFT